MALLFHDSINIQWWVWVGVVFKFPQNKRHCTLCNTCAWFEVQMFKLKHQSTFIKYPFLNSPVPNQNRRETEGWGRERKRERLIFLLRIRKREQMFLRYSFFPLESLPLIAIPSWFYFFLLFLVGIFLSPSHVPSSWSSWTCNYSQASIHSDLLIFLYILKISIPLLDSMILSDDDVPGLPPPPIFLSPESFLPWTKQWAFSQVLTLP